MQEITVYGAGYVGLVTAACLADLGHHVVCVDIDEHKIAMCQSGRLPIYEDGLSDIVQNTTAIAKLQFTSDLNAATVHGSIHVIAVGTPYGQSGAADMDAYWSVLNHILSQLTQPITLVTKSTVPVGTAQLAQQKIHALQQQGKLSHRVGVVSNPEFLRQGSAVHDFKQADRIVIGADDANDGALIESMYQPLVDAGTPVMRLRATSAEFIKYASNAFLATKISFINELSQIAESVGADIEEIKAGMASDHRINAAFFNAGCGYGGSCFPKDVPALVAVAKQHDCSADLLSAVHTVNEAQKNSLFLKARRFFEGDFEGRRFGMWGLAFKPETDDLREAPSVTTLQSLFAAGATVTAYDPVASGKAALKFQSEPKMILAEDMYAAAEGADALFIMTEWDAFREVDWDRLKTALKLPLIFDGRNLYDPNEMESRGFIYFPIGRKQSKVGSFSSVDGASSCVEEVKG